MKKTLHHNTRIAIHQWVYDRAIETFHIKLEKYKTASPIFVLRTVKDNAGARNASLTEAELGHIPRELRTVVVNVINKNLHLSNINFNTSSFECQKVLAI